MRTSVSIIAASIMLFAGAARADGDRISNDGPFASSAVAKGTGGMPDGSLSGGTLRLDPLLPGGGGISASAQLLLFGSAGQPTVTPSHGTRFILRPGFWTPIDVTAVDRVFSNGFE